MKAVFLGRFQPFHIGHHRTVEQYKEAYEDFALVVGSSKKSRTAENPLSFEERKRIIEACHSNIEIVGLEDEDREEEGYIDWTEKLMEKTEADVVITRNNLVQRLVRKYSDAEIEDQELYRPEKCSGTRIRKKIREGEEWGGLVPDCCRGKIEEVQDVIKETG